MPKYRIEFAINGDVWIDAASADAAQIEFDNMAISDLAYYGELERLSTPETQEEIAAAIQRRGERRAALLMSRNTEPEPSHG